MSVEVTDNVLQAWLHPDDAIAIKDTVEHNNNPQRILLVGSRELNSVLWVSRCARIAPSILQTFLV
jgi:hypothetical protein